MMKYLIQRNVTVTLYAFLFEKVTKYKLNDEIFETLLHFDFLQIFYGLTMKPKV